MRITTVSFCLATILVEAALPTEVARELVTRTETPIFDESTSTTRREYDESSSGVYPPLKRLRLSEYLRYDHSLFTDEELAQTARDLYPERYEGLPTTLPAPDRTERGWARERYMLADYLIRHYSATASLAPLLVEIKSVVPGTTISLDQLEKDRAMLFRLTYVPLWFHLALMSCPAPNEQCVDWLLTIAPIGSRYRQYVRSDVNRAVAVWFELCTKPTRSNLAGGPFCTQIENGTSYRLTLPQVGQYLAGVRGSLAKRFK